MEDQKEEIVLEVDEYEALVNRITRMESRIVQLMMHLGLNPHKKAYDAPYQNTKDTSTGS